MSNCFYHQVHQLDIVMSCHPSDMSLLSSNQRDDHHAACVLSRSIEATMCVVCIEACPSKTIDYSPEYLSFDGLKTSWRECLDRLFDCICLFVYSIQSTHTLVDINQYDLHCVHRLRHTQGGGILNVDMHWRERERW